MVLARSSKPTGVAGRDVVLPLLLIIALPSDAPSFELPRTRAGDMPKGPGADGGVDLPNDELVANEPMLLLVDARLRFPLLPKSKRLEKVMSPRLRSMLGSCGRPLTSTEVRLGEARSGIGNGDGGSGGARLMTALPSASEMTSASLLDTAAGFELEPELPERKKAGKIE